jgi:hypothetical protein
MISAGRLTRRQPTAPEAKMNTTAAKTREPAAIVASQAKSLARTTMGEPRTTTDRLMATKPAALARMGKTRRNLSVLSGSGFITAVGLLIRRPDRPQYRA